jgi:DNA-binding transcriptional LysR family regulator
MDTNKLLHFQVVARTANLREAATHLRMTHPGLAKSIRGLEAELGVELLTRDGRGIKVTSAGRRLLAAMQECLDAENRLLGAARGIFDTQRQRVRLGTFEVFSTWLSPALAHALGDDCQLVFNELIPGQLEQALVTGEIDYGITYLAIPTAQLDHIEVTRIQMGLFACGPILSLGERFADVPFVVPQSRVEGTPTRVRGLDGWPDDRIPRNVRYSVSLMETALALLRDGLAAAYLPRFVVEIHNRYVGPRYALKEMQLPARIAAAQPVYAVKSKTQKEDRRFRALCRVLRALPSLQIGRRRVRQSDI